MIATTVPVIPSAERLHELSLNPVLYEMLIVSCPVGTEWSIYTWWTGNEVIAICLPNVLYRKHVMLHLHVHILHIYYKGHFPDSQVPVMPHQATVESELHVQCSVVSGSTMREA